MNALSLDRSTFVQSAPGAWVQNTGLMFMLFAGALFLGRSVSERSHRSRRRPTAPNEALQQTRTLIAIARVIAVSLATLSVIVLALVLTSSGRIPTFLAIAFTIGLIALSMLLNAVAYRLEKQRAVIHSGEWFEPVRQQAELSHTRDENAKHDPKADDWLA